MSEKNLRHILSGCHTLLMDIRAAIRETEDQSFICFSGSIDARLTIIEAALKESHDE